jgi:colicin import membrane protein
MAAAGTLTPSLALAHDALLPRPPGGMGTGAALALVVHMGLLLALTTAVNWRTQPPPPVSAELWASVPQSAPAAEVQAPPPAPSPTPLPLPAPAPAPAPVPAPAPPPAPPAAKAPEPDIAIEKAARAKAEMAARKAEAAAQAERDRVAAEKQKRLDAQQAAQRAQAEKVQADKTAKVQAQKAKADALKAAQESKAAAEKESREAAAEDARLAKQREENLKRMMGQAGNATGRGGSATQEAAPSATYAGRVAARIRSQLVFTGTVPETAETEVLVASTPNGTIVNPRITKSSGHKDWDEAVLRAIDKTATLPRDVDGRVPREMTLVFRRRDQ